MADQIDKNSHSEIFLSENENLSYAFVKKKFMKKIIFQPMFFLYMAQMEHS